jgi:hypothetical protein
MSGKLRMHRRSGCTRHIFFEYTLGLEARRLLEVSGPSGGFKASLQLGAG